MRSTLGGAGPGFGLAGRSHAGYQEVPVFLHGGDGGYARLPELKGQGACGACPRFAACGALLVCCLLFLCPVGWLAALDQGAAAEDPAGALVAAAAELEAGASPAQAGAAPAAVSALAASTTSPPYDCYSGEYAWDRGWSPERLKWCCETLGEGCDIKELAEERRGCNSTCEYGGQAYSCFARVQWAAGNTFRHEPDPCNAGHRAVLQQCPSECAHCQAHWAGCTAQSRMALQVSTPPDEAEAGLDEKQQREQESTVSFHRRNNALALAAEAARMDTQQAVVPHTCEALSRAADPDWGCRDALPQDEGEPLEADPQRLGSIQEMRQWCEDDARCVGFAYGAAPPGADFFAWFYPKRRGTGFVADRAKWNATKHPGESWLFFYLRRRAAQEKPASDRTACVSVCELRGANGTCAEHVVRAARQRFADEGAESCALAITSVMMHCPGCGACPLGGTGCQEALSRQASGAPSASTPAPRAGRPDDEGAETTTTSRAPEPRTTTTTRAAKESDEPVSSASTTVESTTTHGTSAAPSSKKASRPSAHHVRGRAKKDAHEPGTDYDCSEDADGWAKDQRLWCCQNRGVGCTGLLVKVLP